MSNKLYTEEQVNKIAQQVKQNGYWSNLEIEPIELPSDEEIMEEAYKQGAMIFSFTDGAKWMKSKIQGGNK